MGSCSVSVVSESGSRRFRSVRRAILAAAAILLLMVILHVAVVAGSADCRSAMPGLRCAIAHFIAG